MNLPILLKEETSTIGMFINYWKKYYESDKYNDTIYFNNLKPLNELTAQNIYQLFEWKNGGNFSKNKKKSIDKITNNLADIKNRFGKTGNSEKEFKEIYNYSYTFIESGYIWNLFFLHILKPEYCPIADKYVYMAFNFIRKGETVTLKEKWDTYLEYLDFFNEIASQTNRYTLKERKEIDKAFWGFGKFLDNYPRIITDKVD